MAAVNRQARVSVEECDDFIETTVSLGRFVGIRRDWPNGEASWVMTDDHGNGFPFEITELPEFREVLQKLESLNQAQKCDSSSGE